MANQVWSSKRLVYRAVETEHEQFLLSMNQDASSYVNNTASVPVPQGATGLKDYMEYLHNKTSLAAVMCLPAPAAPETAASRENTAAAQPVPIGVVTLSPGEPAGSHHRCSMIAIDIARPYQGQGYGSEAIVWTLNWGFQFANLHRIELDAFAWNPGAIRLYERLGFVVESRRREHLWYNGRFWDLVGLGMLETEWRARYSGEEILKYLLPDTTQEPAPAASE